MERLIFFKFRIREGVDEGEPSRSHNLPILYLSRKDRLGNSLEAL